tara:strand:- start:1716 stop:1994 length:279 start_codon:yes stop_codon:yes gene_type:complete
MIETIKQMLDFVAHYNGEAIATVMFTATLSSPFGESREIGVRETVQGNEVPFRVSDSAAYMAECEAAPDEVLTKLVVNQLELQNIGDLTFTP